MREIRQSGSEGGEVMSLSDPYNKRSIRAKLGNRVWIKRCHVCFHHYGGCGGGFGAYFINFDKSLMENFTYGQLCTVAAGLCDATKVCGVGVKSERHSERRQMFAEPFLRRALINAPAKT